MTIEEAIRILDPATTVEALAEIEYYGGFDGRNASAIAWDEACRIAVAALRTQREVELPGPCDLCEYQFSCNDIVPHVCRKCPAKSCLTEINTSLTLEEIKGMERQPVWVVPLQDGEDWGPTWTIPEDGVPLVRPQQYPGLSYGLYTGNYGKTWLAYRRPPIKSDK